MVHVNHYQIMYVTNQYKLESPILQYIQIIFTKYNLGGELNSLIYVSPINY